ncbi:MAG: hypothetical protein Q9164_002028 [Protoblastenia rupestris]
MLLSRSESTQDQKSKPRPISFGGVFSRTPNLIPGSISPARSVSTRISNSSNPRESFEQPNRAASASPRPPRKPVPNPTSSTREASASPSRAFLDPSLLNQIQAQDTDKDNNINNRFSKFSFVPSYATSSAGDTSDVGNEQIGENDAEDGQNLSRFGSVSTSSEYPPGTSKKVKSPPPGNKHNARDSGEDASGSGIGLPFGVQSSVIGFGGDAHIEDGIMIAGESERGSKLSLPLAKKIPGKSGLTESEKGDTPEIVVNSPKTPAFAHVKEEPKSPRASKTLRVPFLHKFRKGGDDKKGATDPSTTFKQTANVPHDHQQVGSFFDNPSSDSEDNHDDGPAFLGNAKQVSFRRPVIVNRTVSPQLGLTDVLNRGPSVRSQNISPLSGGVSRALSPESLDTQEKRESRRSGVIGWPPAESESGSRPLDMGNHQQGDDRVSGLWNGARDPFAPVAASMKDGLRSHPVSVRKPPRRQVTFPPPPTLDIRPEQRFVREDIVSTPYPLGYDKEARKGDDTLQNDSDSKANLTIVIYGHGSHVPKIKKLSIPTAVHEITLPGGSSNEGHYPIKAIMHKDFDDASLFKLIRTSYSSLRGPFIAIFSARTVCGIRLLSYQNSCQLATKRAKHTCFEGRNEDDGFAEARLLELYRTPKAGRGRWEWFAWVKGLAENNTNVEEQQTDFPKAKVALELIEGFSAHRILLALTIVALCSLVAALLWIFVGVDRNSASGLAPYPNSEIMGAAGLPITGTNNGIIPTTSLSVSPSFSSVVGGVEVAATPTPLPTEEPVTAPTEDAALASFSSAVLASNAAAPAETENVDIAIPTLLMRRPPRSRALSKADWVM